MKEPLKSNNEVLIVDDSTIVLSSLKLMLRNIGFKDNNIKFTSNPKTVVTLCKRYDFDIIICDYNFGNNLNGRQVFEELKHYKLIKSKTIFIIITGDSSAQTVRAVVELEPDEYLLKPFNLNDLKLRINNSMRRKVILHNLVEADRENDYKLGVLVCDRLLKSNPEYYFIIQRYKASFLKKMKLYEEAETVYRETLNKKELDWIKLGLANTLIANGKTKESYAILSDLLKQNPRSVDLHKELSNWHLTANSVPNAISHLKLVSELVPGNSERELVISNLCLSVSDHQSALERYRLYKAINKDTFRDNNYININLCRRLLMSIPSKINTSCPELFEAGKIISELLDNNDLKPMIDLIVAHISMIRGEYRNTVSILSSIYRNNNLTHFDDLYHWLFILNQMSFDTEFSKYYPFLIDSIKRTENAKIMESQLKLSESLDNSNKNKIEWLEKKLNHVESLSENMEKLSILLDIHKEYPILRSVSFKIIDFLGKIWPIGYGKIQVKEIIDSCSAVVMELSTDHDKIQFEKKLSLANLNLNSYSEG
ncbi:response regulator [Vibrio fluvialis]|nr:response regulator [Vibrio fluvialis]MBY8216578.1 response regulator [Vibrio fluvialis]